jgi:hypothetical protein
VAREGEDRVTAYRAVVKTRMDATPQEIKADLIEGLSDIAMELVGEHGVDLAEVEEALENAGWNAQMEAESVRERQEDEP